MTDRQPHRDPAMIEAAFKLAVFRASDGEVPMIQIILERSSVYAIARLARQLFRLLQQTLD